MRNLLVTFLLFFVGYLDAQIAANSAYFDGTDYLEVPNNDAFNVGDELTLSVWIKKPAANGWTGIMSKYNHAITGGSDKQYALILNGSTLYFYSKGDSLYSLSYTISYNEWLHIVGTYKDGEMRLYINGSLEREKTSVSGPIESNIKPFWIGAYGGNDTPKRTTSYIAFPAIYNVALSTELVNSLYNDGTPKSFVATEDPLKSGLVGFWNLANWQGSTGSELRNLASDEHDLVDMSAITFPTPNLEVDKTLPTQVVTFTAGVNGQVSGDLSQSIPNGGDTSAVTATANPGYHFTNWSNGSTENPLTINNVTNYLDITANFSINQYDVTFNTDANGVISSNQSQLVSHNSNSLPVTATANTGYYFVEWDDGNTDNPRVVPNVNTDLNFTASFLPIQYYLAFSSIGGGSIHGASFQFIPHDSSSLPVTATANTGYYFTNWSNGSTANPLTINNVTENDILLANFAPFQYSVTYLTDGNGTISGETSQTIDHGKSASQVTATANTGYEFKQWSDGSTTNPRTVTNVTEALNLTAEFEAIAQELTVEFGEVTTNHSWKTVNLSKTFTNPIVVAGPPTFNGADPSVVRIQNVTANSFQIRIQEWNYKDGGHTNEQIQYIVVEAGSHTLASGQIIEAGTLSAQDSIYVTQNFTGSFGQSPVVLTSVASENEADCVTTRVRNIGTSTFQVRLQEQEINPVDHAAETVNYIAISTGEFILDGSSLKVASQGAIDDVWANIDSTGYTDFIAGFQTTNGGDTGAMRRRGTVGTNLEIFLEEEKSKDDELGHIDETVGYILRKDAPAPAGPTVEFGSITVDHVFKAVSFSKTFVDPVVILGPPEYNGGNESVVRAQNVSSTGFEVRVQEWDYLDGSHTNERIDYVVMERGTHTLTDGRIIEVGSTDLTNTGYSTVNFQNTQPATPIILSSIQTNGDAAAVTRRLRNINTTSFEVKLQEEEAADGTHGTETVAYIIIPAGQYELDGETFTVGSQAGVDEVWDAVSSTGFTRFIATFQTVAGNDTGDMRMRGAIGTNLEIYFEEEQSANSEKAHANETAGFILAGGSGGQPPVVEHTVTFVAGANGSLTGTAVQEVEDGKDSTAVTAVADSGYIFDKWSDNSTQNPRVVVNVQADVTFTALFKADAPVNPPVTGSILSQTFDLSDFNRRDSVTYGDGITWTYGYDSRGNLESAAKEDGSDPANNISFNYAYDPIGNRLTSTLSTPSSTSTKNYTPNDLNQYDTIDVDGTVITVEYDEDGNPETNGDWDLTWDLENRLTKMAHQTESILIEFKYDYRGFRGEKKVTVNGVVTKNIGYLYDGNLVFAELDIRDGAQKLIRKYTWGLDPAGTRQEVGGIGALVGMQTFNEDGSSQKHHVVSDAGGNVTAVLTSNDDDSVSVANTYEYGPFGQVIAKTETVEMPYQFNTKYNDSETGLVYYGFRYYDAKDGRWLNSDPIGVNGGINTYNSASNNMVNGFAGGMSWSGGISMDSGNLSLSYQLDSYGRMTAEEFFDKSVTDRTKWYKDFNKKYKSKIINSAKKNCIPKALLAYVLMNEQIDYSDKENALEKFGFGKSVGVGQITSDTVWKEGVLSQQEIKSIKTDPIGTLTDPLRNKLNTDDAFNIDIAARLIKGILTKMCKAAKSGGLTDSFHKPSGAFYTKSCDIKDYCCLMNNCMKVVNLDVPDCLVTRVAAAYNTGRTKNGKYLWQYDDIDKKFPNAVTHGGNASILNGSDKNLTGW
ncbi:MAG: InlB B-repeat-containing protein [Lentisphaeraceae bacterium]|nr:InlB B-repeat-containing protein [Lentisphaeraceae bacterium]